MHKYLATPSGRVMRPRDFRAALVRLRSQPELSTVTGWDWHATDARTVLFQARRALHRRINERAGIAAGTDRSRSRETDWRRDQIAIHDYRTRRIVQRGSGLRTPEARRAAPDVHAAMTDLEA